MRAITLSSPHTIGPDVTHAQQVLAGANVFKRDFGPGAADGDFGENTSRACVAAKYWLGYPDSQLVGNYGDVLDGLLTGTIAVPADYAARAKKRAQALAASPLGQTAWDSLTPKLGITENPPDSNRCFFSAWYGFVSPWCAMTVSWAYVQAKSKAFKKGVTYAYVPYVVADARAGRNYLSVTQEPSVGDAVCYDWDGRGVSNYDFDHIGLFGGWIDRGAGVFKTREGNTSADDHGSQSNGGGLYERHNRSTKSNYSVLFVHVGQ